MSFTRTWARSRHPSSGARRKARSMRSSSSRSRASSAGRRVRASRAGESPSRRTRMSSASTSSGGLPRGSCSTCSSSSARCFHSRHTHLVRARARVRARSTPFERSKTSESPDDLRESHPVRESSRGTARSLAEQPGDRGACSAQPRAAIADVVGEDGERDDVLFGALAYDALPAGEGITPPTGAGAALVDEPAGGGVDELADEGVQARGVELCYLVLSPAGTSEQPAGDGDPVERGAKRGEPVGGADEALGAARLNGGAVALRARGDANRVSALGELTR